MTDVAIRSRWTINWRRIAPARAPGARNPSDRQPLISVIIPCHNGAGTLPRTLKSLRRQTVPYWEAVVVDDGSTDDSAAIAQARSARDGRIRLVRQDNGGVAAARNAGLRHACGDWLMFLDCDDWISPRAFERLLAGARDRPDAGVVFGGALKVLPDGRRRLYPTCDLSDAFSLLCSEGRLAIHSAIVRRELVEQAGGFDATLKTNEDWDLWQRLARSGVKFASVGSIVAFYYCRPGSLSRRVEQVAADGLVVLRRGHGQDPRVPSPAPAYAEGGPADALPSRELSFLFWCAARDLARGGHGLAILRMRDRDGEARLEPESLGELIASAIGDMLGREPRDLHREWEKIEPRLEALLDEAFPGESLDRLRAVTLAVAKARLNGGRPEDPDQVNLRHSDPLARHAGRRPMPVLQIRGPRRAIGAVAVPSLGPMARDTLALTISAQVRRLPLAAALRALEPWSSPVFYAALAGEAARIPSALKGRGAGEARAVVRVYARRAALDALEAVVRARLKIGSARPARPRLAAVRRIAVESAAERPGRRSAAPLGETGFSRVSGQGPRSVTVPILMYHRVAPLGARALDRYRVSTEAFAQQMAELADRGFRTVTPEELEESFATGLPLSGRPVMLTFDDGYVDFAEHAHPILKRRGFSASLYVVPAKVGGRADWDAEFGAAAPLLDWPAIAALARDGVSIQSHGFSHRALSALDTHAVYEEAVRSAAAIERAVGRRPFAFCYPFGARDPAVERIIEEAGFSVALTTSPGVAGLASDPMRLPRVEVAGFDTLETFRSKLGLS